LTNTKQLFRILRLRRNLQRLVLAVKNDILAPKHNITIDLQSRAAVALYAAEACVGVDLSEGDGVTGDHGHVVGADVDAEVWESGVARVGEATDLGVVGGALDLGVVGIGDCVVDEEERGAGV
jgi:hypothetical protein